MANNQTPNESNTAPRTLHQYLVSMIVSVGIHDLDDARVQKVLKFFGGRTPENDPDVAEGIARDSRLVEALLNDPTALDNEALRRVVWELDPIRSTDEILADIGKKEQLTDQRLLELLQERLPSDDQDFLRSCCEEDLFYDNTSFYQEAFSTEVGSVKITLLDPATEMAN